MSQLFPITVSTRRMASATATAGQVEFPYNFPVQRDADIRVMRTRAGVKTELTLGNDYSVSGVNQPQGGNVVLTAASLAGDIIDLDGDTVLDRLSSVAAAGRFSSQQIDAEFDRALIRDQELRRDVDGLSGSPVFLEAVEDLIGQSLLAGPGMDIVYDDATGKTQLINTGPPGGGSGNVIGPGSSVNGRAAIFAGTTGRAIADSGITLGALAGLSQVEAAQIADNAVVAAKIATDAVVAAKIASAAVTEAKIANAAVTEAKIANAAVTEAKIADAAATLAKLDRTGALGAVLRAQGAGNAPVWGNAGGMTLGTPVNTTSGTAIDWLPIPAGANLVLLAYAGLSTNGSSDVIVQLGTASGIETTGYLGASTELTTTPSSQNYTTGIGISGANAANIRHGVLALVRITGNTWAAFGVSSLSNAAWSILSSGSKTLSGTLDRLRLTTVGGINGFDNGQANIMWGA